MFCVTCGEKRTKFWDKEYKICTQRCAAIEARALISTSSDMKPYCTKCGESKIGMDECPNSDFEDFDWEEGEA